MAEEPSYKKLESLGEKKYDEMYDSRSPAACWSDIKDYFAAAIAEAERAGLKAEVERLSARLDHIRNVYRHQFS
jgi:hypothetical protein